jgi:hypothetical protein
VCEAATTKQKHKIQNYERIFLTQEHGSNAQRFSQPRSRTLLQQHLSNQGGLHRQISKSPVLSQAPMVRVPRMNTGEASTNADARSRQRSLLFASTEEAVVFLELMGFTVEDRQIRYDGLAMATHRTLFAIDWLCGNGFSYAAPTRESCPV